MDERGITLTSFFLLSLYRAHIFSLIASMWLAIIDAIASLYLFDFHLDNTLFLYQTEHFSYCSSPFNRHIAA